MKVLYIIILCFTFLLGLAYLCCIYIYIPYVIKSEIDKWANKINKQVSTTSNNTSTNLKLLIEDMNLISESIKNKISEYGLQIDIKPSSEILNILEEKSPQVKQNIKVNLLNRYDILSYPYWSLDEVLFEEKVVSEIQIDEKIIKRFPTTKKLVKKENSYYGLPFTKITALIVGRNKNSFKLESYSEILENIEQGKFGVLNSDIARSHFYYFFIICGSFNVEPLIITNNNRIIFNLSDNRFKDALEVYLSILKQGKLITGNWNNVVDELVDKKIDVAIIWSEQLSQLIPFHSNEFIYKGVPIVDREVGWFNILEGWFLAKANNNNNDSNDILKAMEKVIDQTELSEILGLSFSCATGEDDTKHNTSKLRQIHTGDDGVKIAKAVEKVNALFRSGKGIKSHIHTGKRMYEFSVLITNQLSNRIRRYGSQSSKYIIAELKKNNKKA